jgi:Tol biopolymer transport system component
MIKARFVSCLLVFVLTTSSCSVEIDQPSIQTIPSTVSPTQSNTTVKWGNFNLTGRLIYLDSTVENKKLLMSIQALDLATGHIVTIFNAPLDSYIFYIAVSPDSKQLIMSYSPPPVDNITIYQALYTMPIDGSTPPQLLFKPPAKEDQYIQVEWSPDGKYIYYTHVNYKILLPEGQQAPVYSIFRLIYPNGQPELVVDKAYWPRISADGTQLAYVAIDPLSGLDSLFTANADGTDAHAIPIDPSLIYKIIDAPMFSADNQTIFFSAPAPITSQTYKPSWIEKLMGVTIALAHGNTPSDLWTVPISGGTPTQITHIETSNLFTSFSPDNKHIAVFSENGLLVMDPDGSELTLATPNLQGIAGTVRWIP